MPNLPDGLKNIKIAVGHDDLTVPYAGGEKVFMAIAEAFPKADVFTSMITGQWRSRLPGRKILTTFMQSFPLKRKLQKPLFALYPLAFESLDLSDYDLVISSSSRFAHGVITRPETKHVCYMHSPGRMFWEPDFYFGPDSRLKTLLTPVLSYLRLWDHTAAQRVDQLVANSKNVADKIKRYYGREAEVVYPFVDLERFVSISVNSQQSTVNSKTDNYFLVLTRLAPWKKVEIALAAVNAVGAKLKVVGIGPDEKRLRALVKSQQSTVDSKIEILGGAPDEKVNELFQNCTALIMTQEEDFGITSLEAQACGKPVIAYGRGGALETVIAGKTGEFFESQDPESLAKVLKKFDPKRYRPEDCRKNAERFSKERFQKEILEVAKRVLGVEDGSLREPSFNGERKVTMIK